MAIIQETPVDALRQFFRKREREKRHVNENMKTMKISPCLRRETTSLSRSKWSELQVDGAHASLKFSNSRFLAQSDWSVEKTVSLSIQSVWWRHWWRKLAHLIKRNFLKGWKQMGWRIVDFYGFSEFVSNHRQYSVLSYATIVIIELNSYNLKRKTVVHQICRWSREDPITAICYTRRHRTVFVESKSNLF